MATPNRKVVVTLDTYLSILAVISSFCAIGITFYQAYLQRTQQYASVMPVLDSYNTSRLVDGTKGYAMIIANDGLGPAFIESASFRFNDRTYASIGEFTAAILKGNNVNDTTAMTADLWKGRVIPQGEKLSLIESRSRQTEKIIRKNLGEVRIEILYKSAYGETWKHVFPPSNQTAPNVKID